MKRLRLWIQIASTALSNGYVSGFVTGRIYQGKSKMVCVPGLNCYSCPGAVGACPIGALQAVIGSGGKTFSFYVIGFLMIVGSLFGRFICGWLCPFGLVQDLLYKIPFPIKRKLLPGDKVLRWLRYLILVVFVIILPLAVVDILGQGDPWFCKWICPSGTLFGGIPLVGMNPGLQQAVGGLFLWKVSLLVLIIMMSIIYYRPFCRYLCPLGSIYGVFNPIALVRFEVDKEACTGCKKCQKACGFHIPVYEKPNSPECIRCLDCKKSCPHGAIKYTGVRGGK